MKILLIHQYFLEKDGAGISRFNQFVKYWTESGHEVTVICGMIHYMTGTKPKKYFRKWITKEKNGSCSIVRVYVSDAYNRSFVGRMWAYLSFTCSSVAALFTIPKHDVVIATSPPLHVGIPGFCASRLWRIPLIFEVRDIWPESAIEVGVLKSPLLIRLSYALESFLYQSATRINVLTPAFRDILIVKKRISPEKIVCIPNGADTDLLLQTIDRDTMRKDLFLEGKFVVLYIGAHGVANHLDQVLDAAHLLKNSPEIVFLFIGTGMKKAELIERATREHLSNVRFLDPVPKERIANYIYASDIGLAVLKKLDIFKTVYPNKLFDYMVCRRPIIVAIDGAARSLVEDARAGVYVAPEDPQALCDAVKTFLQSPSHRATLGDNGHTFATRNFSRSVLAQQYISILQRVV